MKFNIKTYYTTTGFIHLVVLENGMGLYKSIELGDVFYRYLKLPTFIFIILT